MTDIANEGLREQIKPLLEKAALALGSDASDIDIAELAVRIALVTNQNSKAMTHAQRVLTAKAFRATRLESLSLEEKTQRGAARFWSRGTDDNPDGSWDDLRTDPVYTEEGRRMYDRLRGCVGHGGIVFKLVEDAGVFPPGAKNAEGKSIAGTPRKSRVIVYFIDLGIADEAQKAPGSAQGAQERRSQAPRDDGEPYDPRPVAAPQKAPEPAPAPAPYAAPTREQLDALREPDEAGQEFKAPQEVSPGEDWARDEALAPSSGVIDHDAHQIMAIRHFAKQCGGLVDADWKIAKAMSMILKRNVGTEWWVGLTARDAERIKTAFKNKAEGLARAAAESGQQESLV